MANLSVRWQGCKGRKALLMLVQDCTKAVWQIRIGVRGKRDWHRGMHTIRDEVWLISNLHADCVGRGRL
jgi:hypothetical protein